MFDELGDNRHKRAEQKMPHHRVAGNGIPAQYRGTSWRGMLIMLFKVAVKPHDVFKVTASARWCNGGVGAGAGEDGR